LEENLAKTGKTFLHCLVVTEMSETVNLKEGEKAKDAERQLFSQQMRAATRNIHNVSDALVNAKLGVTMSDDSVWAEGLLVFYEIFKFLEKALVEHSDSLIGDLLIPGMSRTEALEKDLAHYLGDQWKEGYSIRPEVDTYLQHLQHLEKENPYLLIPYIYHLYMGLFSGGQVLRATRFLTLSSSNETTDSSNLLGNNVTSYGNISIGSLKKQLRKAVNDLAEELDEGTKQEVLKESVKVFEMNNLIIGSVKGVDRVLKQKLLKIALIVFLFIVFIIIYFYMTFTVEVDGNVFGLEPENGEL